MKGIKKAFDSISSNVTNEPKGCVQCNNDDCSKCKGNQSSYDSIFAERNDEPVPPIPDCQGYNYLVINDSSCSIFTSGNCDWSIDDGINGQQPYFYGWDIYMNTYYQPNGYGNPIVNLNCNVNSTYILKFIGTKPPAFTIIDANCNVTKRNFIQICNFYSWEVTFEFDKLNCIFQSIYLNPGVSIPFSSNANPFDSLFLFQNYITQSLWAIYTQGQYCVVYADKVTKLVTIQLINIYTLGTPLLNFKCGSNNIQLPFIKFTP